MTQYLRKNPFQAKFILMSKLVRNFNLKFLMASPYSTHAKNVNFKTLTLSAPIYTLFSSAASPSIIIIEHHLNAIFQSFNKI